jgi:hypothetical protein
MVTLDEEPWAEKHFLRSQTSAADEVMGQMAITSVKASSRWMAIGMWKYTMSDDFLSS